MPHLENMMGYNDLAVLQFANHDQNLIPATDLVMIALMLLISARASDGAKLPLAFHVPHFANLPVPCIVARDKVASVLFEDATRLF